jgi:hypothetical protein
MPSREIEERWPVDRPPPKGHPDVGKYVYGLVEKAVEYKESLDLHEQWLANHRMARGQHPSAVAYKPSTKLPMADMYDVRVNLIGANITRQTARLSAREPVTQARSTDGFDDMVQDVAKFLTDVPDAEWEEIHEMIDTEGIYPTPGDMQAEMANAITKATGNRPVTTEEKLTNRMYTWWKETMLQRRLESALRDMNTYGPTVTKVYWDTQKQRPNVAVCNIFSIFPSPGVYADIGAEADYIAHAVAMTPKQIKSQFGVEVRPDYDDKLFGDEREDQRGRPISQGRGEDVRYQPNTTGVGVSTGIPRPSRDTARIKTPKAEVWEVWLRDNTMEDHEVGVEVITSMSDDGTVIEIEQPITEKRRKYPGGIRRVTIANRGDVVLSDVANPNVNEYFDRALTQNTYLYDRFPFIMVGSLYDNACTWPHSEVQLLSKLNIQVNMLISKLYRYLNLCLWPPLIVPWGSKITPDQLSNSRIPILQPPAYLANHIRFIKPPNLPSDFKWALNFLMQMFDREWGFQDVDRGEAPGSIRAASAIASLQEKSDVLMQHKTRSTDFMVAEWGKCAIALWQNLGLANEDVEVAGKRARFTGIELIDRQFKFTVDNGSTIDRPTAQIRAEAMELFLAGALPVETLLEELGVQNWREIAKKMDKGQLELTLEKLAQQGIEPEILAHIRETAGVYAGGAGHMKKRNEALAPKPGVARTGQGLPG